MEHLLTGVHFKNININMFIKQERKSRSLEEDMILIQFNDVNFTL